MSRVSRRFYTYTATVEPFTGKDAWGSPTYGTPYTIACTFVSEQSPHKDAEGIEFVSRYSVFTEDSRPKYLDRITLPRMDTPDIIRQVTTWDTSFFGDTPDYKLVTG